jgi:serine phosphatase RsbU (regulator of sigma subunit)/pSer/pThr/pTyr-binding forkhead associated (FHA) protein
MASLKILKGTNQGTDLPLDGEQILMGRNAECQIVINLPAVSREHAVIKRVQNQFFLEDLKSRNKTYVNEVEVKPAKSILLKHSDKIKICDNVFEFLDKRPLTDLFPREAEEPAASEEESSSTVEATLSHSSKQILETQPAEKLAILLGIAGELTQTFSQDQLLPKIVDSLFQVFRQADRSFVIFREEEPDRLVPKVIRTRRAADESTARFSRAIVRKCLETGQSLLSEDASADKRFDLSQSIADCRIRSVMCAPLAMRSTGKVFGVIQVDTQERNKKFGPEDLKLLLAVAGQAAIAVENARLHETLVARAGLERDLKLAHQVQLSFLPKRLPQLTGYDFFAHYEPALEVGGDYYDFIPLPQNRLGVMVGDVAGKGVPAALLMAKVSSDARFSMLTEAGTAEAVFKLNELMQEAGLLDRFVTLAAGLLDPGRHAVTIVNAGHLPPLVYRHAQRKVEEAFDSKLSGFPLGVAEGIPYEGMTVPLEPGDTLVMFTDGITEAKNKQDREFQMENVYRVLENGPTDAKALGKRLVDAVKQHALGCKPHDDITVVCFGRAV